jgi:hypothetical protein
LKLPWALARDQIGFVTISIIIDHVSLSRPIFEQLSMYRMVGHEGDVTALRKSSPAVTDRAPLFFRVALRLALMPCFKLGWRG